MNTHTVIKAIYHCPCCDFECDGETTEHDFQRDRPACPNCEAPMTSLHVDPEAWRAANAALQSQQAGEATIAFEITHRLSGVCDFTTQWLDAARLAHLLRLLNSEQTTDRFCVAYYMTLFHHILARDRAN
jgi:hypothetical protein